MQYIMIAWELASYYKLGNDLALIQQSRKNPMQVFVESSINEDAKRYAYNLLNNNYR